MRVGVLEIFQLGAGFLIAIPAIVVVVGMPSGELSEVLKGGKICLVLLTGCLTVFHHQAQELCHGWIRRWGEGLGFACQYSRDGF